MSRPKNIASVAKERLINPLATTREVEQATWIDHTTVSRIDKQLQQFATKDDRIIWITDKDLENIKEMQALVSQKIRDPEEMKSTKIWELAQAMREATTRYSLFRWSATDEQGWLIGYDILNDLQSGKLGREDAYSLLQKSKE